MHVKNVYKHFHIWTCSSSRFRCSITIYPLSVIHNSRYSQTYSNNSDRCGLFQVVRQHCEYSRSFLYLVNRPNFRLIGYYWYCDSHLASETTRYDRGILSYAVAFILFLHNYRDYQTVTFFSSYFIIRFNSIQFITTNYLTLKEIICILALVSYI